MLDRIVTVTVSRRPLASVLALAAMSVVACVSLTACDAAAENRPAASLQPMPPVSTDTPAVHVPMPPQGGAALRSHREDVDPSHAAIGSYTD